MIAGCTGALRGGVLYLTLDTRGSSVNVFTPPVALELERELEAGLAAGARAVVLQSAKPGSFVNGVGLLLAASSHAQGAAMERAHILRRCYERLAAAPVPTIAAIEGNCYGCGRRSATEAPERPRSTRSQAPNGAWRGSACGSRGCRSRGTTASRTGFARSWRASGAASERRSPSGRCPSSSSARQRKRTGSEAPHTSGRLASPSRSRVGRRRCASWRGCSYSADFPESR